MKLEDRFKFGVMADLTILKDREASQEQPKCTKCGQQLQVAKGISPSSHGYVSGGSIVTTGAPYSISIPPSPQLLDAISISLHRNDHDYTGNFCGWNCMIEWLNDNLLPQMAMDVISE